MVETFRAKLSKNNRRPVPVSIEGYRGWLVREYHTQAFMDLLAAFLSREKEVEQPLKVSKTSRVFQRHSEGRDYYIKIYSATGWKVFWQSMFRIDNSRKSWRIGWRLRNKGIDTPQPVVYLRRRLKGFAIEHILVLTAVRDSMSLRDYVSRCFQSNQLRRHGKRIFIKRVAEFLGRLHLAGVYHGDLTARNILVEQGDGFRDVRLFLIDLDAVRSTCCISRRRRIKNLDELGRNFLDFRVFSTYDRARFLKYYLESFNKEKKSFKGFFKDVERRTRRRLIKHGQHFTMGSIMKK